MASPRILVVRPDRIGDVVLSTPVLRAIRQQWPNAYLAMMVRPYTRAVLLNNPWLDEILTDDPEADDRGIAGFMRQVKRIRSRRFDTGLMLLPTMRMAWMMFLAGVSRRVGVGHTIYQTLTGMRSVSRNRYIPLRHEADYCLDLARAIGASSDRMRPEIFLTQEEQDKADSLLRAKGAEQRPLIGIHPGNGHSAPNWTPEQYAVLADHLCDRYDATIIVTGSAEEQHLENRMAGAASKRYISLFDQLSLRALIGVISRYDLMICSSTGPMHIAAALNIPTLALFCPLPARSPTRWGPLSDNVSVLIPPYGECDTCDQGPMCDLAGITMEMALKAVEGQLKTVQMGKWANGQMGKN